MICPSHFSCYSVTLFLQVTNKGEAYIKDSQKVKIWSTNTRVDNWGNGNDGNNGNNWGHDDDEDEHDD
jgi:hypothetical protein